MALKPVRTFTYDDYGVVIICPLEVEVSAMRYMLDEEHPRLPSKEGDSNRYLCGRMNGHNVVIAYLPQGSQGVGAAAVVATDVKRSFPHVTLRLLVGIGGGVPSPAYDIRLGDVVVSMPTGQHGGVVQYDLGKDTITGFERKGFLEPPPTNWRNCVVEMQSDHRVKDNHITTFVEEMIQKHPRLAEYRRPKKDTLFVASNKHILGEMTCGKCDYTQVEERPSRSYPISKIFYGLIASGNRVEKNAELRDQIAKDAGGALCFEMEAAGLMNDFRSIVIRGISDYADSHKNDDWHAYAAAVAAGCAKELLSYMGPDIGMYKSGRNQHWIINRPTNPYFTGRTEVITEITNSIRRALEDDSRLEQHRVVITGMGGQGKSEVCLHVANQVRSLFWGVFWVDVDTPASAESGFLTITSRLKYNASKADDVCQHLANLKQPWLLILDNADDASVDYQQYFPAGSFGVIMLTSRNPACHQYATEQAIALNGLPTSDACTLLQKAAQTTISLPLDTAQQQRDIVSVASSLLTGHPLAILQAGAYIAQGHCSFARYSQVFERQRKRLLTFRPKQAQSRYRDVYATFEASAEILEASSDEAASDAMQVLLVLSMLASSELPLSSFFEAVWYGAQDVSVAAAAPDFEGGDVKNLGSWHMSQLLPLLDVEEDMWDSFRLVEAIRLLERYSLVIVNDDGSNMRVLMHPLTHAWAKDRQAIRQQQESWLKTACMVAVSGQQWTVWQQQQALRPHLSALLSVKTSMIFEADPQLAISQILWRLGLLLEALRIDNLLFMLCREMLQWLRLDNETVDKEWLPIYELTGRSFNNNGQVGKAVTLLEQVVRIKEQTLAEEHPSRLASQHALAGAYEANGQVGKAVTLLEQVVQIQEQTLAEEHPSRLASQQALAATLWDAGDHIPAFQMMQRVAARMRSKFSDQHPERVNTEEWLDMMKDVLDYTRN